MSASESDSPNGGMDAASVSVLILDPCRTTWSKCIASGSLTVRASPRAAYSVAKSRAGQSAAPASSGQSGRARPDHRVQTAALQRKAKRLSGTQQMALADHQGNRARTQRPPHGRRRLAHYRADVRATRPVTGYAGSVKPGVDGCPGATRRSTSASSSAVNGVARAAA